MRKMVAMSVPQYTGFYLVSHIHRLSKNGGSRAGYHCPDCGCFYAEGNFTIENMTHVLGITERKVCCGKERPTPRLFETFDEVRDFLSELVASLECKKATLIDRRALIIAHFDRKLVAAQKQKMYH